MLYEYMQRRSELNNEQFQEVIKQLNQEEMVATQTILDAYRKKGVISFLHHLSE